MKAVDLLWLHALVDVTTGDLQGDMYSLRLMLIDN
jgi:hypothetical protein